MKKSILSSLFVAFSACVLLLPDQPADAAEQGDKTVISASTVYEERKGQTVTVEVYIKGTEDIAGGSLQLDYDEGKLTNVKADAGEELDGYIPSLNAEEAGTVSLSWAKAEGSTQDGTLVTISGRTANGNEEIALDLNQVQLFKEDGSMIETDVFDGVIKPFGGKTQKHENKVNGDRNWKITMNKNIHPATVNSRTIKILNSRGAEMDTVVNVQSQRVFTVKPKSTLSRGTYTLLITEQVHSKDGKPLKEPIQFEYTVE